MLVVQDSRGKDVDLSIYKGKVLLVVNVASKWLFLLFFVFSFSKFRLNFINLTIFIFIFIYFFFYADYTVASQIQIILSWLSSTTNTRTKVFLLFPFSITKFIVHFERKDPSIPDFAQFSFLSFIFFIFSWFYLFGIFVFTCLLF